MVYLREEEEGRALAYVASIFFSLGLAVFAVAVLGFRVLLKSARSMGRELANGFRPSHHL